MLRRKNRSIARTGGEGTTPSTFSNARPKSTKLSPLHKARWHLKQENRYIGRKVQAETGAVLTFANELDVLCW